MTKELGGKKFAQALAAISVITAPLTLGVNSNFSMNSFDLLFWTLALYLLIRIVKEDNPKQWLFLGIIIGLGLLNKISVLWLGAGLFTDKYCMPYENNMPIYICRNRRNSLQEDWMELKHYD